MWSFYPCPKCRKENASYDSKQSCMICESEFNAEDFLSYAYSIVGRDQESVSCIMLRLDEILRYKDGANICDNIIRKADLYRLDVAQILGILSMTSHNDNVSIWPKFYERVLKHLKIITDNWEELLEGYMED